jgi:hypothetical protein
MGLGVKLIKKLEKPFPPNSRTDDSFRGNDFTVFSNEAGEAVTFFIGKRKEDGDIHGERYSRRIVKDASGKIIKSHWDLKGKT